MGASLAGLWGWAGGRWGDFTAAAILAFIFILITVIDIEHRLILWRVVLPGAVVIGVTQALNHGGLKTLWGGLAGYGLVLGMYLLGQLFSVLLARVRGRPLDEIAFGGGDVNLAALAGLAVGWPGILLVLTLAVFGAGIFSLVYLFVQLVRGRYNPYTAIPYGPFFVLGVAAIYLFSPQLRAWYCGLAACPPAP
jgi:leader peptidase (prepilin peptidase)/N-methyltransferase